MAESGAVVITNREIYDEVVGLKEAVSKMTPQAERLRDHETRIRGLERLRYAVPASAVSGLLSVVLVIWGPRNG